MFTYKRKDFKLTTAYPRKYPAELKEIILKVLTTLWRSGDNELLANSIEKYPDEPTLRKLWLVHLLDNSDLDYKEGLTKMRKDFPKDIEVKLTMVFFLLDKGEFKAAERLLGKERDVRIFAGRKKIERTFFLHYYWAAAEWAYRTGAMAEAKKHYKLVHNITDECKFFYRLDQTMFKASILHNTNQYKKLVDPKMPKFHHKEITTLYKFAFFESQKELIDKICTLPRETLREDLVAVMKDGKKRYSQFSDETVHSEWRDQSFVLQAFSFLGALKYEEELDLALELLQDDDYLYLWFGDFFVDALTPVLYALGLNHLDKMAAWAKQPDLPFGSWVILYRAMSRCLLFETDHKEELIAWFIDIIDFLVEKAGDKRHADPEFISIIINNLCMVKAKELLPHLERLDAAGLLQGGMLDDDIDDIRCSIEEEVHRFTKKKLPSTPWEFFEHKDCYHAKLPLTERSMKLRLVHMSKQWGGRYSHY